MGSLPTGTSLPSGTSLPGGTSLPSGTSLPAGDTSNPPHPSIIFAGTIVAGWDFGLNVTSAGGLITQVNDFGPGNFHQTAAGAARVTLNTADSAFIDGFSATSDGTNQFLGNAAIDLPAPGTTPTHIRALIFPIAHTSADHFYGQTTSTMSLSQGGVSPSLSSRNTTVVANTGAPVGAWSRVRQAFSNNAADKFRLRATEVTGNAGATDPGVGFGLFARSSAGGGIVNAAMRIVLLLNAEPTGSQDDAFDNWVIWLMGGSRVAID